MRHHTDTMVAYPGKRIRERTSGLPRTKQRAPRLPTSPFEPGRLALGDRRKNICSQAWGTRNCDLFAALIGGATTHQLFATAGYMCVLQLRSGSSALTSS